MRFSLTSYLYCSLFSISVIGSIFFSCGEPSRGSERGDSQAISGADARLSDGSKLAEIHCSTCHLFPEPGQLDRRTWTESVLPNMGARLGIKTGIDPFTTVADEDLELVERLRIYPDSAVLSQEEWQKIVAYYAAEAPEALSDFQANTPVSPDPAPFDVQLMEIGESNMPKVSLLEYDDQHNILYIGDHLNLYALNTDGQVVSNWSLQSPAVDVFFGRQSVYLLSIGRFDPSDQKEGVLFPLLSESEEVLQNHVITDLQRPVHFSVGDLDADAQPDVVISEFGNHTGKLSWYSGFDREEGKAIHTMPGTRKTFIRDMNGDGRMDVVALLAQARESVMIFYQREDGSFREEPVLEFPAVYGVSYIDLVDFDGDGREDILVTNGDNWDYSRIPKPYHGLRIFLNKGDHVFQEDFFFPMNGCSQAMVYDFDRDADLDIVAISFYNSGVDHAGRHFVYLQNEGEGSFSASYLDATSCGRWLTMDLGDFNGDGYMDVFLGSYFHTINELSQQMYQQVEAFPQVLVLTFDALPL